MIIDGKIKFDVPEDLTFIKKVPSLPGKLGKKSVNNRFANHLVDAYKNEFLVVRVVYFFLRADSIVESD